jgi:hypothetical protein
VKISGATTKRRPARPKAEALEAPRSTNAGAVARDLGAAAQSGAARAGLPTSADWQTFLERIFVYTSVGYAWWLTNDIESDGDDYELTDTEAHDLAEPLSRIVARSAINKRYGKQILGGEDWLAFGIAAAGYAYRTRPALRDKQRRMSQPKQQEVASPYAEPIGAPSAAPSNGSEPAPIIGPLDAASVPPQQAVD